MDDATKKIVDMSGGKALIVGDQVIHPPWQVSGQAFHFDALQTRFIYALQQTQGNIDQSCRAVMVNPDWATRFLASQKFREFRNAKLHSMSVRNGDLVEEWWEYGRDGMKGYRERYEGVCTLCKNKNIYRVTEVELTRDDQMQLHPTCKVCLQTIEIEKIREDFKPTREQVQFWSELGNRLSPKIERVHHEFSAETFVFEGGQ